MFAYMISEWRDWSGGHMERTVISCVALIAFTGIVISLHPFGVMLIACMESIWLGWYLGNRYWRGSRGRDRFMSKALTPAQAVAGKIGAALLIFGVHALAIVPVLIVTAILWGMSPWALFNCLAISLSSFLVALGLGLFFSLAFSQGQGLAGTVALCFWLAVSAVAARLWVVSPFMQIWMAMDGSTSLPTLLCAPVLLLAAAALFLSAVPLLKRLRARSYD